MLSNPKFPYIIRIIAAIYIVYLAISLIGEIQKGAVTGGMMALGIIGIIAFFAFSVWAVYSSVKGLMAEQRRTNDQGDEIDDEEAMRIAEEEEKARIIALTKGSGTNGKTETGETNEAVEENKDNSNSLFARMQRLSNNANDADDADEVNDADDVNNADDTNSADDAPDDGTKE